MKISIEIDTNDSKQVDLLSEYLQLNKPEAPVQPPAWIPPQAIVLEDVPPAPPVEPAPPAPPAPPVEPAPPVDIDGKAWDAALHHPDRLKTPKGKWRKRPKSVVQQEQEEVVNQLGYKATDVMVHIMSSNTVSESANAMVKTILQEHGLTFPQLDAHPAILDSIAQIVGFKND